MLPYSILPIQPGSLLSLAPAEALPPAEAPAPVLEVTDITYPPLPAVAHVADDVPVAAPVDSPPAPSGQPAKVANAAALCLLPAMLSSMYLSHY